jgi:hypothetical protein
MTITDPDTIDAEATEHGDDEAPHQIERHEAPPVGLATHERLVPGLSIPIVPAQQEIAMLAQMAVTIAGSMTAPKALQGKPNDCFMVLLTGRDLGLSLTTAMRECHVIDGKVTLSPKVKNAMVKSGGHGRTFPHQAPRPDPADPERELLCPCGSRDGANDTERATWHAERADELGILYSSTFTKADAERPQGRNALTGKDNWQNYPQRMMSWRALGYLLDDVFPEVGTGLYSPDELGAVTDADGEPVLDVVGRAQPIAGTSAPRGHNAPPPPPEPPASADDLAALRARIAALAVLPEARTALVELWTKPRGEDGSEPTLPPIDRLMAKQVKIADAMVSSIEARAKKGEWGAWEPAGEPAGADDAPAEPETAQAPAGDATGPAQADEPPAPAADEITTQVIAEVKAMEPSEVTARLESMNLATDGRLDSKRHRLASAMIAQRRSAS